MKKETILLVIIVLAVAVLVGVVSNKAKPKGAGNPPADSAPAINYQQNIKALQDMVAEDPNNRQLWIQLGNGYFDSGNAVQAIEAYDKALALDGEDPDVLTDQGIMYRRVGWFDKALANFVTANKLNSRHAKSLYYMGVVYSQDLGDKIKAEEAWNRYLELVPTGKAADKVRTMIEHMKYGHG